MSKHTPGPWDVASDPFPAVFVTGSDGLSVAEVWLRGNRELANARLIAAAPELLRVVEACLARDSLRDDEWLHDLARAAISKATGEAA